MTELRRGPAVGKNDEAIGNCILSILSYSHHLISNSLSVWSISEKTSPNGDKNPLEGINTPLESSRVYVTMALAPGGTVVTGFT